MNEYPYFHYSNLESGLTLSTYGIKQRWKDLNEADQNGLIITARHFNEKEDPLWENYPEAFHFTPKEIYWNDSIPNDHSNLLFELPELISVDHSPSYLEWEKRIDHALEIIEKGSLNKVVLARKTTLTFNKALPIEALIFRIRESMRYGLFICLQISPESAFISMTPEKLYTREENSICVDSLAGTISASTDRDENIRLINTLLHKSKELNEFNYVTEDLLNKLTPLCHTLGLSKLKTKQAHNVHHLYRQVQGSLENEITDERLIQSLHPTAAVGGLPLNEAKELIDKEPFARGYYSAPIGWINRDRAEIGVAIRSGLIRKNQLHLFAATGIVKGSTPEKEWEELNLKMSPFYKLLSQESLLH